MQTVVMLMHNIHFNNTLNNIATSNIVAKNIGNKV